MQQVLLLVAGSDSCKRQPLPPEACCHWNFGAGQVHGGSSEHHTSLRPCFVQDGRTGSLHKCSGLDGPFEEFVRNGAGRKTINNRLLSRSYRAYRPTRKPLLTVNHRRLRLEWAQRWQNLTRTHWQHVILGDDYRFQLHPVDGRLRVRRLPGEHFQQRCQAYRVQAGGGSRAFHSGAKSPLVLQDDNATLDHAQVINDFLQQGNVTKMEQPARSPDCNPIKYIWDELGRAVTSMDNPPQNFGELRQTCWINGQKFLQNACNAL